MLFYVSGNIEQLIEFWEISSSPKLLWLSISLILKKEFDFNSWQLVYFSSTQTFHSDSPDLNFNLGNDYSMSSNSTEPAFALLNISVTTASFSIGFSEHVEYATNPPTLHNYRALYKISIYRGCKFIASTVLHFLHISGIFLVAPSPEQGTSARTLSKYIFLS